MRVKSASRRRFGLLLAAAASCHGLTPVHVAWAGANDQGAKLSEDCFEELENGRGAEIACSFPLRLTEQERTDLRNVTRQYLQDLTCSMTIRIDRAKVDEAIRARDHTFQSPEQPVTCHVTTKGSAFDVTATFAPQVVFKNDTAVYATPGLGNVKGVSRVLSWPVMLYVNRGPGMRSSLLQIVNAYRTHARQRSAGAVP
jgi:hypothetical protein